MTIVLSLISAVLYGAADFCGGIAARRVAALSVALVSQTAGLIALLAIVAFLPGQPRPADYLWGALAGLSGGAGIALLYHALSIGKMGVVSPVTAVLAAVPSLIVGTVRGDHLAISQIAGIVLSLAAIVLISFSFEESGVRELSTRGLREALLAGLIIGGFFAFISQAHPSAGLYPLLAARTASVVVIGALALWTRSAPTRDPRMFWLIVAAGLIDILANACYVLATFMGALSIAVVLASLYPASTVFLARVVLKERLARSQWFGVALALAGVSLIAWR